MLNVSRNSSVPITWEPFIGSSTRSSVLVLVLHRCPPMTRLICSHPIVIRQVCWTIFFKSAFTVDNGILPYFPSRLTSPDITISDLHITPNVIKLILRKLKINSAAGPDGLPPIFYNKASPSLIFPLSILFRTFFELHDIPSEWKHAIITPIFKKGAPSNPLNYRPIALTCTCCKIFESLIAAELLDFLKEHNLISKHQHGFLKRHSTNINLLECLNDWTLSISNHKLVHIGYIDFQRAFDSISHPKLILKLSSYGISGNLLFWIKAFLLNRTQSVRVGSKYLLHVMLPVACPKAVSWAHFCLIYL